MSVMPTYTGDLCRDQHGFTLIETLVAMVSAIVVTGALFTIYIVALHQTSRITDSVQATQLGRTAMTRVVDELHSACLSRGLAPIQAKSSATELIFENGYSREAVILNAKEAEAKTSGTGAFVHQIVWSSANKTLTDYTYKSTAGEWPSYTFPEVTVSHANASPSTGFVLASHVTAIGSTPVFRYYEYNTEATGGSGSGLSTLAEEEPPTNGFTAEEAEKVAAVQISFTTAPLDNYTALSRSAEFSTLVSLSLSTPSSESKIEDGPCQ
jgi:type II secretory pathway pseudopilin PulG